MHKYYIYRHIRLDKNIPFYIGVGTKREVSFRSFYSEYNRAFDANARNIHWKRITSKVDYKVEILLEYDTYEEAKEKEIELIALYGRHNLDNGNLCNMTDGGEGVLGKIVSKEHRVILAEKSRNRIYTREDKRKAAERAKGNTNMLGKVHSEVSKLKMSRSSKTKRKVVQLDMNNNMIKTYDSMKATEIDGFYCASVSACCSGKRKSHKGYKWKHYGE